MDSGGRDEDGGHEEGGLELLLPFYVNGSLSPEDRARVDRALAASQALRVELVRVREVQALVQAGGAAFSPPGRGARRRLKALLARL